MLAPSKHLLQHFNDIVSVIAVCIARFHPRAAIDSLERIAELLGFTLLVDKRLELGQAQIFAEKAAVLIEHTLECA